MHSVSYNYVYMQKSTLYMICYDAKALGCDTWAKQRNYFQLSTVSIINKVRSMRKDNRELYN